MGLPNRTDHWPILRKVFHVGRHFVCGICRAPFETEDAAHGCLEECWQETLVQDGVTTRPGIRGVSYRCRFCSRDYAQHQEAAQCATSCRERLIARAEEDRLAAGALPPAKKKRGLRVSSAARRPAPAPRRAVATRAAPQPSARSQESIEQPDIVRQVTAAAASKVIQVAVSDADDGLDAPSTKRGRPKTEFKKAFSRDGAKYVCASCRETYFTKKEVEACFEGHFDGNGFEVVKG